MAVSTHFPKLWLKLADIWTSKISGYLMDPIRDNEDFQGADRNVENSQNWAKR